MGVSIYIKCNTRLSVFNREAQFKVVVCGTRIDKSDRGEGCNAIVCSYSYLQFHYYAFQNSITVIIIPLVTMVLISALYLM